MLVQPLLRGTGEGLFGLAGAAGIEAWSAHRRVRMMNPAGSGSSACASIPVDPTLPDPAAALLLGAQWRGPFMLELLRDDAGRAWFVEFNGRMWGSLALARRAGLEYPAWAVRQALDPTFVPAPTGTSDGLLCRHAGRELVHLMMVARGPRSDALATSWPGRLRSFGDVMRVRRTDRWYNFRRGNGSVLFADTVQTVADAAKGAVKKDSRP
jgi:hypothetical protein